MVGIIGVPTERKTFSHPAEVLFWEDWYRYNEHDIGAFTVGMASHGRKDASAHQIWCDGERVGLLFGVIPNRNQLGWSVAETFNRILDAPKDTLSKLEGPFLLAAVDGATDHVVLATDKIGSRPGYYTTQGSFAFSSELKGLIPLLSSPQLNQRAVSDLLLLNSVWGEKTLVEGIRSVRPGHYVEFQDGEVETERYWQFTYGRENGSDYTDVLADRYRDAIDGIARTIDGPVGLWLSGGIDSRVMASVLTQHFDTLNTYTYVRPQAVRKRIGREDIDLAPQVAEFLEVPNTEVSIDGDRFSELLPRCVDILDGMIPWTTLSNLAAVFELPANELSVVLEGSGQSELLGEDMWSYHLEAAHYDNPIDPLLQRHGRMNINEIQRLLSESIDPLQTLEDEVAVSPETDFRNVVTDTNNRNLFTNMQFLSNKLTQSQVGTRHPFADGRLLDQISKLDPDLRMHTLPFTGGKIPCGYTKIKIDLTRKLNGGLEQIPYERTNVPLDKPYALHTLGFVVQNTVNRPRASPLVGNWLSESRALRLLVLNLLHAAIDRSIWNDQAVTRLMDRLEAGDRRVIHPVAVITTVELWAQRYIDMAGVDQPRAVEPVLA